MLLFNAELLKLLLCRPAVSRPANKTHPALIAIDLKRELDPKIQIVPFPAKSHLTGHSRRGKGA